MKVFGSLCRVMALNVIFITAMSAQTNLNMVLQDSLDYLFGVNDVAGWADDEGNEYAIVGVLNGVSIVNVDETPIREVVFVPGQFNGWRDINTFGHYAYVVSEAFIGLQIIDLQYLPDSVKTYTWKGQLPGGTFQKAHTIWIDEFGIAYLNGTNLNDGGFIMVDIATNPTEPIYLGSGPAIYAHDVYSRDSIVYSAEIYEGNLSIYDATDPQQIQLIGRTATPNEFTHNAWLSDNSRYLFTTDERPNSYVGSFDIIDPANPVELDRFRQASTAGSGNIPHNVYVVNDWIVIAYYTSGTVIVDAARPDNLIEVGSYDSYSGPDGGFDGVWGTDPFLPSGKILSSDRSNGLFVYIPTYVRAAYLEGTVIDSITKLPIQGASVQIVSDEIVLPELTGIDGGFKTGKAVPGIYDVVVKKSGYQTKTVQLTFTNGVLLMPLIELDPLETHVFSGRVIDQDLNGVPFAEVVLIGENGYYDITADANGDFLLPDVYEGSYEVQAGVWGKTIETDIVLDNPVDLTLQVVNGYHDDFDLDLGWTVSGDATEGEWERGLPTTQIFDKWVCGPGSDSPFDVGPLAFGTGMSATDDVTDDEVSRGSTFLTSPPMDLDSVPIAHISFDYWICEYPPNQYTGFYVYMLDGADTTLLASYQMDSVFQALTWRRELFIIDEWSGPKDQIQIMFVATDTTSGVSDYTLKVLVDNFRVEDAIVSTEDEWQTPHQLLVYPNPLSGNELQIKPEGFAWGQLSLRINDLQGRLITSAILTNPESVVRFAKDLNEGFYTLNWQTDNGLSGVEKVIVVKD